MSKLLELQPLQYTSRTTNCRRASETDVREQIVNFQAPTPNNSPTTTTIEPWKGHFDHSSPPVFAVTHTTCPGKLVHVDNDVMQALEILLEKKIGKYYSSEEALDVAQSVFNTLPSGGDQMNVSGKGGPLVVDFELFSTLARGRVLGMAVENHQAPSINQTGKEPRPLPSPKGKPLLRGWKGFYKDLPGFAETLR